MDLFSSQPQILDIDVCEPPYSVILEGSTRSLQCLNCSGVV